MKSVPQDKSERKPAPPIQLLPVNPATMLARQQAARVLFGQIWERHQRELQEAASAAD